MIGLAEGDAEPVEANSNRAKVKTNRAETDYLGAIKFFPCAIRIFLLAIGLRLLSELHQPTVHNVKSLGQLVFVR